MQYIIEAIGNKEESHINKRYTKFKTNDGFILNTNIKNKWLKQLTVIP